MARHRSRRHRRAGRGLRVEAVGMVERGAAGRGGGSAGAAGPSPCRAWQKGSGGPGEPGGGDPTTGLRTTPPGLSDAVGAGPTPSVGTSPSAGKPGAFDPFADALAAGRSRPPRRGGELRPSRAPSKPKSEMVARPASISATTDTAAVSPSIKVIGSEIMLVSNTPKGRPCWPAKMATVSAGSKVRNASATAMSSSSSFSTRR